MSRVILKPVLENYVYTVKLTFPFYLVYYLLSNLIPPHILDACGSWNVQILIEEFQSHFPSSSSSSSSPSNIPWFILGRFLLPQKRQSNPEPKEEEED